MESKRTVFGRVLSFSVTILILSIMLLIPNAQPVVRAAQTSPIVLKLEAGFESYFREDRWVPLLISVSNNGPDVSGELRVTATGTTGLGATEYRTASIDFPTNSSKQVFLYITLKYIAQQVKIELANDSGIIADSTQQLRPIRNFDLLYAVVTESPRGTIDLKSVKIGAGDSFQATWRVDNIPRMADGLRSLDVLVLADVDTGNLTTEQRKAIEDWVTGGGHLVVTGGPNWQKTQAGVANLLPMKPTGTTTLISLPEIARYAGRPADTLDAPAGSPIIVSQGQLIPGAQALVAESGTGIPLLVRRTLGEGYVDYLTADPGIEPFQSWKGRGDFWFTLFSATGEQPIWSSGIANPDQASEAAALIKGLRLPDVFQLGLFLGVYILVIGPLNYLVLRQLGRRELAWITIPVIIVACSAFAYMTGFSLRGTQATVNRMALVQVWPNSERAQVDGVIGVLAPRRALYTLGVKDDLTLRLLNVDNVTGVNSANFSIQEDLNYAVKDFPVDAGVTAAFAVSGFTQASPLEGNVTLTLSQRSSTSVKVSGRVKNTTNMTLNGAVILALGGRADIGTLEPGEERQFDFLLSSLGALPAPPLTLGNGLRTSYFSSALYGGYNSNGQQERTIQDIMGRSYIQYGRYGLGYGETPEQQEARRRQAFLQSLISTSDPTGGRGSHVYLAAWTDNSPIGVDLQGATSANEDMSLYMYNLPVNVVADGDIVEIPPSLLTWTATDASTRRDAAPYNLNIMPGDKVVLRYNPLPEIPLSEVTEIDLIIRSNNVNQGVISLWDWTTGAWVPVNVANRTTTSITDNVQHFIGPENSIQLSLEPAQGMPTATYDRIDLKLLGRLNSGNSG